ncbi:MAG: hypothetical protein OXH67_17350 [Acidimicrobiaceae bacterium]|nr:hypothetical protein [Acidimicrobiaceae bacterium]
MVAEEDGAKARRERPVVYMVCTGNAARSPMAAAMLRSLDTRQRLDVRSAGTLTVEGHPMGIRTRSALARHGLTDHAHRSRQFRATDAAEADLVVVMEPLHLHWMRRNILEVAPITGSLRRLARDLMPPQGGSEAHDLGQRVRDLGLDALAPEAWEEIVDPGAGEQDDFDRCSDELRLLVAELDRRLG